MAEDEVRVLYAPDPADGAPVELSLPAVPGRSLFETVRASGILERFPRIDPASLKLGVWGKLRDPASPAQAGDRVEIYRPLLADPKASRHLRARTRARKSGARKNGTEKS